MLKTNTLSISQARRVALAAQGLARQPGAVDGPTTRAAVSRLVGKLHAVQIDSVNVLVRSHYLPIFSRMGAYDVALLEAAAYEKPRQLTEYWAHEASFIPVELHPYFRWRMAGAHNTAWQGLRKIARERPDFVEDVRQRIVDHGPLSASELETEERQEKSGPWWDWRDTKKAVEWLFWSGQIAVARRRNFERVYDIPERVLPKAVISAPTPDEAVAQRELMRRASQALGVATETDLRDYFRFSASQSRAALAELLEAGDLIEVAVEGWTQPAYVAPTLVIPRVVDHATVLSPFDSLVWSRPRTERLFSFRYRLEIYTPAPKRIYGYYVLPFLMDGRLVARVDVKTDRQNRILRVHSVHLEDGHERGDVVGRLHASLCALADWLGVELGSIEIR